MNAEQIMAGEDFRKCVDFHGHLCPGLIIGYRAALAGMDWLRENRAEDEELVSIVENSSCAVDAIQCLTGCTFGKGNFIHRDYGKHVYTFLARKSGQGVRVSLKSGAFQHEPRLYELMPRVQRKEATEAELTEFRSIQGRRNVILLEKPLEDLFVVEPARVSIPPVATVMPSEPCARCGEPTMGSKLVETAGVKICPSCLNPE